MINNESTTTYPPYLQGNSEIVQHIINYDWLHTPMGAIEKWSQTLHTTLSIVLLSKFPMFLYWGNTLQCFYNEAFKPSLGINSNHPTGIGQPAHLFWAEIWETIKPLVENVMAGEPSVWIEDTLIPIYRNGKMEEVYWTYGNSPVYDEQNNIIAVLVTCTETTKKVGLVNTLFERKNELTELANAMPQLVWVADNMNKISFYNNQIANYDPSVIDENGKWLWSKLLYAEDYDATMQLWNKCIIEGLDYTMEHRLRMKNGSYRWHLSRAFPQKNEENVITKWFGTATDIDEIKMLEKRKDDFIKMASHELKTPITSIKGYVQLLQEKYGNSTDTLLPMALNTVERQINKLTKLISELLDVQTIENGSFMLTKIKLCINELIKETLEDLKIIATKHTIHFENIKPLYVHADKERIAQVVINLITNAIKYSATEDSIIVKIGYDADNVIVSVQDNGIGIDSTEHHKIFKNYYRVSGNVEETFPGFGLGLFIVHQILKQHDGKIWLDSKRNAGATFYFSLPLV